MEFQRPGILFKAGLKTVRRSRSKVSDAGLAPRGKQSEQRPISGYIYRYASQKQKYNFDFSYFGFYLVTLNIDARIFPEWRKYPKKNRPVFGNASET
ncbi:MAG TPA: hypothetical protein DC042_16360 [Bacteroidales bacterium]|nr:hypothetical protein [Bacteroidales bacterium]